MSSVGRKNTINMITYLKELGEYENYLQWRNDKRYEKYKEGYKAYHKNRSRVKIDENKQALINAIAGYKNEGKTPLEIFELLNKLVSFLKIKRIYNEV